MVGISLFSSELNNDYEAVKELTVFEEKLKTDFASNSISKILK